MPNPTPPNAPVYPISALYLYPIQNTSATPVDPTRGFRNWQMTDPIPAGKTANSLVNLGYFTSGGDYGMFSITYGEAMSPPNIAPSNLDAAATAVIEAGPYGLKAYPVPARALLPTESVSTISFLGLQVTNSAYTIPAPAPTAQQSTDSTTLAELRTGLDELLNKEGLPTI